MEFAEAETKSLDARLTTIPTNDAAYSSRREYAVKVPSEEKTDFVIEVRASTIRKIRENLENAKSIDKPIIDILLCCASLFGGGFLGSFAAVGTLTGILKIFIVNICPVLSVGCFVAFFFLKSGLSQNKQLLIDQSIEMIPNPNDAIGKGEI